MVLNAISSSLTQRSDLPMEHVSRADTPDLADLPDLPDLGAFACSQAQLRDPERVLLPLSRPVRRLTCWPMATKTGLTVVSVPKMSMNQVSVLYALSALRRSYCITAHSQNPCNYRGIVLLYRMYIAKEHRLRHASNASHGTSSQDEADRYSE